MFYNKFIFLFLHLCVTLCFCDTDDDAASVTPKLYFVGGVSTQDPNNPTYTELAEKSLQKYLQTTGNTNTYKMIKIEKVVTQVVAGIKTSIDFTVSPTNSDDGDTISCNSIILEQAWKNLTDIDVTCEIKNQANRTKKQVIF